MSNHELHLPLFINNPAFNETDQFNRVINTEPKSVYNKWLRRQFGLRIPIHIFGSSSEGNSVYLKPYRTLVDLGLPYKTYNEYHPAFFLDVDYIILTHHHGDHLNPSTLKRIMDNHPHIRVIISDEMKDYIMSERYKPEYIKREPNSIVPFGHDPVYQTDETGRRIQLPPKWREEYTPHLTKFMRAESQVLRTHDGVEFLFEPLTTKHGDIVNIAIQITDPSLEFHFLYASDLDNLGGERTFEDYKGDRVRVTGLRQDRMYNLIMLEANYDKDILENYLAGLDPLDPDAHHKRVRAEGNLRHISEQEATAYMQNVLTDNGIFIPLHASKTFGTLHQD